MDGLTLKGLRIVFDPSKSVANRDDPSRGFGFERVHAFDFDPAMIEADTRFDYGEDRYVALGVIGERVHVLVFTVREPDLRVISLRKANDREVGRYEEFANQTRP